MRLAKADDARAFAARDHGGVLVWRAPFQHVRSRLGRNARGVVEILPRDRHAIQRPAAEARFGAGRGLGRLRPRAVGHDADIDPVRRLMRVDGGKIGFGHIARVQFAAVDLAAGFRGA